MRILLGEIMYKKNISVRHVSRMMGVPPSTINDIMNERSYPRLDTLKKIAEGLKIHISDLYESPFK